MGEIQIPFATISSASADLCDPENALVNYFLQIDTPHIEAIISKAFNGPGPRGYGVSLFLSRILKVKQGFVSDRILAQRLKEVATYRRICGFIDGHVPAHNTYHTLRSRLGVHGYAQIHAGFLQMAQGLNLLDPHLPMLPKNRRKGLILIGDSTTIRAYCSTTGKKQPDGGWLFQDPSVNFGRPHHRDKFPVGHKAHSLITITGLPMVSLLSARNEPDQDYLFPLLNEYAQRFPDIPVAYIILDKGYDSEEIHRKLFESYEIIPVIIRKKMTYPHGFDSHGTPLCKWGYPMTKMVIDYKRKRTKYACKKNCGKSTQLPLDCTYQKNTSLKGQIRYTKFTDGYRKYGPVIPSSILYKKLKPFRTAIERNYGLIKENRYRMENTNTYMGIDNVLMHVIEHDIALTLDILFMLKHHGKISPVINLNY